GIAAYGRNHAAIQQGAGGRWIEKTPVGMPGLGKDRRLLVRLAPDLDHARVAGDRQDIRVVAMRAERLRETLEIRYRQLLIRKRDDLVPEPGVADRRQLLARKLAAQVDAAQQRAAALTGSFNADVHGALQPLCLTGESAIGEHACRSRRISRWQPP